MLLTAVLGPLALGCLFKLPFAEATDSGDPPTSQGDADSAAEGTGDSEDPGDSAGPGDSEDPGDSEGETCEAWTDSDGDGHGAGTAVEVDCDAIPEGLVTNDDDCDDSDGAVNPGAAEVCNGIDDDCSGAVDSADVCPCPLQHYGGHAYLFCNTSATWYQAQSTCEALDNYLLVVLDDASEQSWVTTKAAAQGGSAFWWLGYHNLNATPGQEPAGGYEWVDGSSAGYENWRSGEPDDEGDDGDEDCAHLDTAHGGWSDLHCSWADFDGESMSYVCESTVP